MINVYLYSSVRNFVIASTDENGEIWYMTNNKQLQYSVICLFGILYTAKIAKHILYIFSEIFILCIKYVHKMHRYRNIYFVYAKNILKMYILNI